MLLPEIFLFLILSVNVAFQSLWVYVCYCPSTTALCSITWNMNTFIKHGELEIRSSYNICLLSGPVCLRRRWENLVASVCLLHNIKPDSVEVKQIFTRLDSRSTYRLWILMLVSLHRNSKCIFIKSLGFILSLTFIPANSCIIPADYSSLH